MILGGEIKTNTGHGMATSRKRVMGTDLHSGAGPLPVLLFPGACNATPVALPARYSLKDKEAAGAQFINDD